MGSERLNILDDCAIRVNQTGQDDGVVYVGYPTLHKINEIIGGMERWN